MNDETILFQQMSAQKQATFIQELKTDYRAIVLNYFSHPNVKPIENFTDKIFYSNIPVPQVIQIHMDLIDEFSKQLKIEGRSDEVLLDYRLTLIDILAHLCEMYRRKISKHSHV